MTRDQECIVELITILGRIEDNARRRDLSLLRVSRGASGCDAYQGLPPICRIMDDVLDRFGDVIYTAMEAQETGKLELMR